MNPATQGPLAVGEMGHDTTLSAQIDQLIDRAGRPSAWKPVLNNEGVVAIASPDFAAIFAAAPEMRTALVATMEFLMDGTPDSDISPLEKTLRAAVAAAINKAGP